MRQFLKNNGYIILLFLFSVLCSTFGMTLLYSIPMVLISYGIICLNLPRKHFIPLLLSTLFTYREQTLDLYQGICVALVMGLLVYDLIRHRHFRKNPLIIGYLVWIATMVMSLFTAIDVLLALQGIAQALLWFMILYYCWIHMNDDMREYGYRSFSYFSIAIALEIGLYFLLLNGKPFLEILRGFELGWGGYAHVSLLYLVCVLMSTLWYLQDETKWGRLMLVLFQLLMAGVFNSKGSYIAMLLLAVPYLILVFQNTKRRSFLGKIAIGYLIFALLFRLVIANPLGFRTVWYERVGLQDRLEKKMIFELGLEAFRGNPLFGIGAYNSPLFLRSLSQDLGYNLLYFQNYWVQTLATLGIVGMISFLFLGSGMVRMLKKRSLLNYFIGIILGLFLIQGLFDTTFYSVILMCVLSLVLSFIDEEKGVYLNVYDKNTKQTLYL